MPLNSKILFLVLISCLLVAFFSFVPSLHNNFIRWDDPDYVIRNENIRNLDLPTIKRIFTSFLTGDYHPLTVISLAIDYQWTQLNPFGYHVTNIGLHLANTLLVFLFAFGLTKNILSSIVIMLLFGIHPTRVESVAWITERKDVLYLFFYLCGLNLYVNRTRNPSHYGLKTFFIILAFFCSLLSKPAAVSFPIVLFLIDYYLGTKQERGLLYEKIALLTLSLIFGVIAIYGNWCTPLESSTYQTGFSLHLSDRIILSVYTLILYIGKCLWPVQLSAYYPYPEQIAGLWPPSVYLCLILFMALGAVVFVCLRRNKNVVFGTLFFISTILFNLPFFGAGHTIMADRFTYLPYLGLFLIISYILSKLCQSLIRRDPHYKYPIVIVCILLLMLCVHSTRQQNKKWETNLAFWSDIAEKHPRVSIAYYHLAKVSFEHKQWNAALFFSNKELTLNTLNADSYALRGMIHITRQETEEACHDFDQAATLKPNSVTILKNQAGCYLLKKDYPQAVRMYENILKLEPEDKIAAERIAKYLKQSAPAE